jgi:hypothetical protein
LLPNSWYVIEHANVVERRGRVSVSEFNLSFLLNLDTTPFRTSLATQPIEQLFGKKKNLLFTYRPSCLPARSLSIASRLLLADHNTRSIKTRPFFYAIQPLQHTTQNPRSPHGLFNANLHKSRDICSFIRFRRLGSPEVSHNIIHSITIVTALFIIIFVLSRYCHQYIPPTPTSLLK